MIQHYVIKVVIDLRQVGGFLRSTLLFSTNKTDRHDITEILLKVALNTIAPSLCVLILFWLGHWLLADFSAPSAFWLVVGQRCWIISHTVNQSSNWKFLFMVRIKSLNLFLDKLKNLLVQTKFYWSWCSSWGLVNYLLTSDRSDKSVILGFILNGIPDKAVK